MNNTFTMPPGDRTSFNHLPYIVNQSTFFESNALGHYSTKWWKRCVNHTKSSLLRLGYSLYFTIQALEVTEQQHMRGASTYFIPRGWSTKCYFHFAYLHIIWLSTHSPNHHFSIMTHSMNWQPNSYNTLVNPNSSNACCDINWPTNTKPPLPLK